MEKVTKKILIKGMIKSGLESPASVLREYKALVKEGADIVRVAVLNPESIPLFGRMKQLEPRTLVEADIHFNHTLALRSIDAGVDIVRLNPLNVTRRSHVESVIKSAKERSVRVRIGINSGGFRKRFSSDSALAAEMVRAVGKYITIFEKAHFHDIILSFKAPSIETTFLANKKASEQFPYPLDVGITASGPYIEGIVRSSIGISQLLQLKHVESLRVSLSAPSYMEIRVGRYILQCLGLRKELRILSCPTCSRCKVRLFDIIDKFKKEIQEKHPDLLRKDCSVAIMGCEVNGPGEASQADIGIACGRSKAVLFSHGKQLESMPISDAVTRLVSELESKFHKS